MSEIFCSKRFLAALNSHLRDARKDMFRNFMKMTCYLLVLQLFFIFYLAFNNQYGHIIEVTVNYSAANSIFVLGGALFPRNQFLITLVCFCAFIALLAVLPIDDVLNNIDKSGTVTGYVALVVFYLVAALNYWLAYRRFIR